MDTNFVECLKHGMDTKEWERFNALCKYALTNEQIMDLAKRASKPVISSSSAKGKATYYSFEELEALYYVEKEHAPEWLRHQLDTTFKAASVARDSTTKETQQRRIRYMLGIDWRPNPPLPFDYHKFITEVKADVYGWASFIERVAEMQIAGQYSSESFKRPLLIVGPYGCGKTHTAKTIAKALNMGFHQINLNGLGDAEELKGAPDLFSNGDCGKPLKKTFINGSPRQVLFWDEFDKTFAGGKNHTSAGEILDALIDFFGDGWFYDSFIGFPVDLRQTLNICTANSIEGIPKALLDRMEIIYVDDYTQTEKEHIAKEYLWARLKREYNQEIDISDEAVHAIVERHLNTTGVRSIEKDLEDLMRFALKSVNAGTSLKSIEKKHVDLRLPPVILKKVSAEPRIGTATALAVSEFVGSVLELQVDVQEGVEKLKFSVTGLASEEVMESCQVALRLAAKNTGKSAACDVHLHLDASGIKKEGPSSGLMVFAALWSAFSETPLSNLVCGTGEIDLFGKVKPVSGIEAKLIAAARAGCSLCFIPAANKHQIPDGLTMKVVPVSHVDEMTSYLLENKICNPMNKNR